MPRKRSSKKGTGLPQYIREHGSGYRAVITLDGERTRSRTLPTVEAVRSELREMDAKPGTFKFYDTHARTLFNGLGGEGTRVDTITAGRVQNYVNARREKGVKGATIVGKLMLLRRMLKIAAESGVHLPTDCMKGLGTPHVQTTRFGYLTPRQITKALKVMRSDRVGHGVFWADIVELLFQIYSGPHRIPAVADHQQRPQRPGHHPFKQGGPPDLDPPTQRVRCPRADIGRDTTAGPIDKHPRKATAGN